MVSAEGIRHGGALYGGGEVGGIRGVELGPRARRNSHADADLIAILTDPIAGAKPFGSDAGFEGTFQPLDSGIVADGLLTGGLGGGFEGRISHYAIPVAAINDRSVPGADPEPR